MEEIIVLEDNLFEQKRHGHFGFPLGYYQDSYEWHGSRFFYYHWHSELEIQFVLKGKMIFLINDEEILFDEGDVIIVNRNILHKACHEKFDDSRLLCYVFNPCLIYGYEGSDIETRYVTPILECGFSYIHLKPSVEWQKSVIDLLFSAEPFLIDRKVGFEIEVVIRLQKAWKILFKNFYKEGLNLQSPKSVPAIKKAMEFIYMNFMHQITLDDIAKSAFVSKGECCKLFKRYLKTTPIAFLQEYRVNKSIEFLMGSEKSIADIAKIVGFESANYYTIAFKKQVNETPSGYKKSHLECQ